MRKAKPVVKIPGGKRQVAAHIISLFPDDIEHYYEPFAGGLAVFFAAWNAGKLDKAIAYLADLESSLIELYRSIMDDPSNIVWLAEQFSTRYVRDPEATYYKLRDSWNEGDRSGLNRLLLSKTGFNGLWRMNKKGELNVAWNKESTMHLPDLDDLTEVQHAFHGTLAQLDCFDFQDAVCDVGPGTMIYLDPPYHGGFVGYGAAGFGDADHVNVLRNASVWADKGAKVVLSCSATAQMREWLAVEWPKARVTEIMASRRINRDGAGRSAVKELLCIGYEPDVCVD